VRLKAQRRGSNKIKGHQKTSVKSAQEKTSPPDKTGGALFLCLN